MSQYFGLLYILNDWTMILYIIPSVLFTFWTYGIAHACAAKKLECFDKTQNGAFTLNPLKYIDIFGFILMCAVGYGWSRTQPTDIRKLSKRQRILIYSAGPLGNLAAAIIMLLLQCVILVIALNASLQTNAIVDAVLFLINMIVWCELIMFVTHIIPIPGFNGYNILKTLFFDKYYHKNLAKIENNGKWIFVLLALLGGLFYCAEIPASFLYQYMTGAEEWLADLITGGLYSGSSWTVK